MSVKNDPDGLVGARGVTFGFTADTTFLGPVDLQLAGGSLTALVGPNGAGKSTLLRLLAGLLEPRDGTVELQGRPLAAYRLLQRARVLAFLPQHPEAPPSATVDEVVRLGRFPHRSVSLFESAADLEVVRQAMAETETAQLSHRLMGTLSGGEAQRVHLAAALAQQPRVLLLDEPTSDLDLYYQLAIFHFLRGLAHLKGLAILAASHDLNLAGQFCDHVILLAAGRIVAQGPPAQALHVDTLQRVYGVKFEQLWRPGTNQPWLIAVDVARDAQRGTA